MCDKVCHKNLEDFLGTFRVFLDLAGLLKVIEADNANNETRRGAVDGLQEDVSLKRQKRRNNQTDDGTIIQIYSSSRNHNNGNCDTFFVHLY